MASYVKHLENSSDCEDDSELILLLNQSQISEDFAVLMTGVEVSAQMYRAQ